MTPAHVALIWLVLPGGYSLQGIWLLLLHLLLAQDHLGFQPC